MPAALIVAVLLHHRVGNPSTPCLRCMPSAQAMTRFTRPLKPSLMGPACPAPAWEVIIPAHRDCPSASTGPR
jgi:hypothetical protein